MKSPKTILHLVPFMKHLTSFVLALCLIHPASAEPAALSEIDRQLLLEKLVEVQKGSDTTVKGRLETAYSAFQKALASETAAVELYLNCYEKVHYADQVKKGAEFRDWKRRFKERVDGPEFRLALRHQLNWLVLTLEAIKSPTATWQLGPRCVKVSEAILTEAEKLQSQRKNLRQDVLKSEFAQAYEIDDLKPVKWPKSPLDLDGIYDILIFPKLREDRELTELKAAWQHRILLAGKLTEAWANEASADRKRKPAFEKWLIEKRPGLAWKMEVDLFKAGDEKGAALRMLAHLEKHLEHKSAPGWIKQFKNLVDPGSSPQEPEEDLVEKEEDEEAPQ